MYENNIDTIKRNIKSLRIRAGLKQKEVAELIGISRQNYCIYEMNPGIIKIDMLIKLSNIFHCTLQDFFYKIKCDLK